MQEALIGKALRSVSAALKYIRAGKKRRPPLAPCVAVVAGRIRGLDVGPRLWAAAGRELMGGGLVGDNADRLRWLEEFDQETSKGAGYRVGDDDGVGLHMRVPRVHVHLDPVLHCPHHGRRELRPRDGTRVPLDRKGPAQAQHAGHEDLGVTDGGLVEARAGHDAHPRQLQQSVPFEHRVAAVRDRERAKYWTGVGIFQAAVVQAGQERDHGPAWPSKRD
eukprot:scaffold9993_cov101-Isochrysis_galbana.AAC.6